MPNVQRKSFYGGGCLPALWTATSIQWVATGILKTTGNQVHRGFGYCRCSGSIGNRPFLVQARDPIDVRIVVTS